MWEGRQIVTQPRNLRLFCLCNNCNNQQRGKKTAFRAGQSPNTGEEAVEASFRGSAQIQLLCGFASARIPKTLTDGFGHYAMKS